MLLNKCTGVVHLWLKQYNCMYIFYIHVYYFPAMLIADCKLNLYSVYLTLVCLAF